MDEALKGLVQTGVLGMLVVILLFAIAYLFKALQTSCDDRVKDLMSFKETIDNNTQSNRAIVAQLERLERKP